MSLAAAAKAVGGQLPARFDNQVFERVTIDSRGVRPGDLFVALKGERVDGHDFVVSALQAGASGALVDAVHAKVSVSTANPTEVDAAHAKSPVDAAHSNAWVDAAHSNATVDATHANASVDAARASAFGSGNLPRIVVRDTRLALAQLARSWRAQFTLPLIGVAGSNGKTTVTQMIASILRAHLGPAAFHTEGNYNNDIGLPLTVLRLTSQHRMGVVELGMNHRGEIAFLAGIARPTIGLVNNAQREHQEFLSSVADVAAENASLYDFLPHDGIAIVNADDDFAQYFTDRAGGRRTVSFGSRNAADVRVEAEDATFGSHLRFHTWQGSGETVLRIAGRHNAQNAAAATAAALAAGIPLDTAMRGLREFAPVAGRLVKTLLASGVVVLDDSYNANPDSVRAAVDVLHGIAGRRVLVLGPMAEVGDQSAAFHREVGEYARERGIDALITIGTDTALAADAFGKSAKHYADIDALIAAVKAVAVAGTTVLIKGSRSARMERVVRALTGAAAVEGAH